MDIVAQWHSDSGHAWLKVWASDCERLGLKEGDFSRFSYKRGRDSLVVYFLECDSDAGLFLNAAEKLGAKIEYIAEERWDGSARIRNLPRLAGKACRWDSPAGASNYRGAA